MTEVGSSPLPSAASTCGEMVAAIIRATKRGARPGPRLVHIPSALSSSQRSPVVSSGRSFAQVAGAILRIQT
jgi:hypothetical protein